MKYDISEFRVIEKDVRGERNECWYLETESEGAQTFFSTIKYTLLRFFSAQFNWKRNQWRAEPYYWESVFDFTRNTICSSSCNGIRKNIIKHCVGFFYVNTLLYTTADQILYIICLYIYMHHDTTQYRVHCWNPNRTRGKYLTKIIYVDQKNTIYYWELNTNHTI